MESSTALLALDAPYPLNHAIGRRRSSTSLEHPHNVLSLRVYLHGVPVDLDLSLRYAFNPMTTIGNDIKQLSVVLAMPPQERERQLRLRIQGTISIKPVEFRRNTVFQRTLP